MRIVSKISTAGASGLSRIPVPAATIDECLDSQGRLDPVKARLALDIDQVQTASTDDRRVLAFALEYLTQIQSVVRHLTDSLAPRNNYRAEPATVGDRHCKRNMDKGRFTFVRTDITACRDGIHAKLSVQNPKEVIGNAEKVARDHAVMCAQILLYLKEKITTSPITLIEGDGAGGVYYEATALERRCDLRKKRDACPSRTASGYCSPIRPDCPLYLNGKCREP